MKLTISADQGRAAQYLARVNLEIVKAAGQRRQRQGQSAGARLPAAIAGAPVRLVELSAPGEGRMTPLGYHTARRDLPRFLADLRPDDPRRKAGELLAAAAERLGAVKGVDLAGGDSKGGLSDGGATTRVKHAARFRLSEALANGWPRDGRTTGPGREPKLALEVRRRDGKRKHIQVFHAVLAVCVDGADLYSVLRRHGWSAQAVNAGPLREAILSALDDIAQGFGLGRAAPRKAVDS